MIKTKARVKDIRRRMSNNYIFDEPGEPIISVAEDMEWALGAIESLIEESGPFREVHHIMRRVGTDELVKVRVVKLESKRWWEFWKTSDRHEQDFIAFDFLWVLVR